MEDYYDVTESLLAGKADERMIAFAGFVALAADARGEAEGVLKIAAFTRPDGNGYLTLTFVIDLDADTERKGVLQGRFAALDQDRLTARLGDDFEMLLDVPLNSFGALPGFYVEELNIYFRRLAGNERNILEDRLVPLLSDLIGARFEPLDWGTEGDGREGPAGPGGGAPDAKQALTRSFERRLDRRPRD